MKDDDRKPRSRLYWHDRSEAEIADGLLPHLEDGMIHGWMTMDGTVYSGEGYPVPPTRFRLDTQACAAILVRRPDVPVVGRDANQSDLIGALADFAGRIDRFGFVNALPAHARTLRDAIAALRSDTRPIDWFWTHEARPDGGRRVVVLYEDGSGAVIGYWTGDVLIDADGEDLGWRDDAPGRWTHLPQGFELWCETRSDDPFTFPDPPDPHAGERP